MAPHLVRAHAAVRPIAEVRLWNRSRPRAEAVAAELAADALPVTVVDDLEAAVRSSDIVSCATLSREPLVQGAWLRPGTHVDLVGGFTAEMRESDDAVMRRGEVFVDTFEGAMAEAGDILLAIGSGALTRERIRAELHGLCAGLHPGRTDPDAITVFKSVGTALEDLVAAKLVHRPWRRKDEPRASATPFRSRRSGIRSDAGREARDPGLEPGEVALEELTRTLIGNVALVVDQPLREHQIQLWLPHDGGVEDGEDVAEMLLRSRRPDRTGRGARNRSRLPGPGIGTPRAGPPVDRVLQNRREWTGCTRGSR